MPFQRGNTFGKGRVGPNRVGRAFREATLEVFERLGMAAYVKWARENQTEFYKIAARMIPTEQVHSGTVGHAIVPVNELHDATRKEE